MMELRIALLANCNIELLQKPLSWALEGRGIRPSIWIGGFGQYVQEVLDPASGLYRHDPSLVMLYLDGADLFQELVENPFYASSDARRDLGVRCAAEVTDLAEMLAERLPQATLVLNTAGIDPANAVVGLEHNSEYGLQDAVHAYNAGLVLLARRLRTVIIVDVASLAAGIGFENWFDCRLWYLARSRWSRRAIQALAKRYSAAICGRLGRIRKCAVLDLDNTLWGGVVGEDGLEGLLLGEDGIGRAFVEFQIELLNLYRKGILLAICSKNNSQDALEAIRRHPAMRLREEHFAAMRINWEDKASNLRTLAEELNIGLDSMIFLDDSPTERAWVRQACPEVLVPDWPEDPSDYKAALLELSACHFHQLGISAEDHKRGEAYQAQAKRRQLENSASSIEEFYSSLEMHAKIGRADDFSIPRIAQLTQKTNQFNLTARRYNDAEIEAISRDPNYAVWWVELADRFGPSGIVGVLILKREAVDAWIIDTFLLSCRVMGRTVETAFLAVATCGLGPVRLIGEFRHTAKNAPVRDLYARLGFRPLRQGPDRQLWELDLASASLVPPSWFKIEMVPESLAAVC
jgi:FkbH-like protein